jgi:anthranilate phosphoribosyltransferase
MASSTTNAGQDEALPIVNLKPLLTKLWPTDTIVTPDEIADAISHFFTNQVSEAQTASLLMALHFTKLDFKADVLERCAYVMRKAAAPIPVEELQSVIQARGRKEGTYTGGLVSVSLRFTHLISYLSGDFHIHRSSLYIYLYIYLCIYISKMCAFG